MRPQSNARLHSGGNNTGGAEQAQRRGRQPATRRAGPAWRARRRPLWGRGRPPGTGSARARSAPRRRAGLLLADHLAVDAARGGGRARVQHRVGALHAARCGVSARDEAPRPRGSSASSSRPTTIGVDPRGTRPATIRRRSQTRPGRGSGAAHGVEAPARGQRRHRQARRLLRSVASVARRGRVSRRRPPPCIVAEALQREAEVVQPPCPAEMPGPRAAARSRAFSRSARGRRREVAEVHRAQRQVEPRERRGLGARAALHLRWRRSIITLLYSSSDGSLRDLLRRLAHHEVHRRGRPAAPLSRSATSVPPGLLLQRPPASSAVRHDQRAVHRLQDVAHLRPPGRPGWPGPRSHAQHGHPVVRAGCRR